MTALIARALAVIGGLLATLLTPALGPAHELPPPLIDGYFVYASSSAPATSAMLDDIQSVGATHIVTFGTRLRPATTNNGTPTTDGFRNCVVDTTGCITATSHGRAVRNVYTYTEQTTWHPTTPMCPGDHTIDNSGARYTILWFPTTGTNQCDGPPYDVVVTKDATGPSNDKTRHLLTAAAARGMTAYVGLPAPAQQTGTTPWLPDTTYLPTLATFTERFLTNLTHYPVPAATIAGVYQSIEMPLSPSRSWDPVLDTYRTQHHLVATHSTWPVLISPYIDARTTTSSATHLTGVPAATQRIISTSPAPVILAPQDGQGTGKVGAFTPSMSNDPVDAPSAQVAGHGTYTTQYLGSVAQYMRQVVAGTAGQATVWINVELMTATTTDAPQCDGASNGRGQTTIDRVRRQVGVGTVPGVTGVIGFMWTPYVTCGTNPLLDGLRTRPAPTHTDTSPEPARQTPREQPTTPHPAAATNSVVATIQHGLHTLGYTDVGPADGLAGPRTQAAIVTFQNDAGHPATGRADLTTAQQITHALDTGWQRPHQAPVEVPVAVDTTQQPPTPHLPPYNSATNAPTTPPVEPEATTRRSDTSGGLPTPLPLAGAGTLLLFAGLLMRRRHTRPRKAHRQQ